jgi:hypothetical protein
MGAGIVKIVKKVLKNDTPSDVARNSLSSDCSIYMLQ